jgi:ribose 1,5-bisphosphokinase PhnN
VEIEGTIKGSFADVELANLKQKVMPDGTTRYRIDFELVIALGAAEGTLQCKLMCRGREIGRESIAFSYS